MYGFGSVDGRGRVSDLLAPRAMGWTPGTRVELRVLAGLVVARARADAVARLTGQRYLRLPAPVRCWCGLVAGDRVLLVAEPAQPRLVVHPPASLDRLVAYGHAALREEATSGNGATSRNDAVRDHAGERGAP
ncbi:MAG: AbrB/MazE/SpoVT family DNA-binding domain-containing protein [Pseudonocardia sp.]|nr:AbrB/MazE/SpoVT family DNA-binding domain-containing protein [Pseudonocardia sp.]